MSGTDQSLGSFAPDLPTNIVQGLFRTTGSVMARYDYSYACSPFGEACTSTGAATIPLRFASREMDACTGLDYVRVGRPARGAECERQPNRRAEVLSGREIER